MGRVFAMSAEGWLFNPQFGRVSIMLSGLVLSCGFNVLPIRLACH